MTDRGTVRESNEDQFLVATLSKSVVIDQSSLPNSLIEHPAEKGHIFLVADGFGGGSGRRAGERPGDQIHRGLSGSHAQMVFPDERTGDGKSPG